MFDCYRVTPAAPDVYVNIEAPKVSMDEVSRQYQEIRDRAEADAMKSAVQTLGADNELKVVNLKKTTRFENDTYTSDILVSLNGISHRFTITHERAGTLDDVARLLAVEIVKQIIVMEQL